MGWGVPQDLVEAYKWYSFSWPQGNLQAGTNLTQVAGVLTPEQVNEGLRRISNTAARIRAATTAK